MSNAVTPELCRTQGTVNGKGVSSSQAERRKTQCFHTHNTNCHFESSRRVSTSAVSSGLELWEVVQRRGLRTLNPPIQVRILVSQPPASLHATSFFDNFCSTSASAMRPCGHALVSKVSGGDLPRRLRLFRSSTTAVRWSVKPRDLGSTPRGGAETDVFFAGATLRADCPVPPELERSSSALVKRRSEFDSRWGLDLPRSTNGEVVTLSR